MILKYAFGIDYDDNIVYFEYEINETDKSRYLEFHEKYREDAYREYRYEKLLREDPSAFYGI